MSDDLETETLRVELAAGGRLDAVLASAVAHLSRARLQKLIRAGHVRIDGEVASNPAAKISPASQAEIDIPPPEPAEPLPENIPLDIRYEDDDLIVIDKPAGLVVHPGAGNATGTLVNALLHHAGNSLSGIGGVARPGIVHRLDKDTSGLLVVAKNDQAHHALAAQFADHGRTGPLERAYAALVWGVPAKQAGTVDLPLARDRNVATRMAVDPRGRHAITHWKRMETFAPEDRGAVSLVECRLETGRTHQIRVHMGEIGHPLLGDPVYGGVFKSKSALLSENARSALKALDRQALHARLLAFAHPKTGESMRFESDLPPELASLVESLRS